MKKALVTALITSALLACAEAPDGSGAAPATPPVENRAIINGTPSTGLAYRAVAVLWTDQTHLCSGTLIAPSVILTAAHCFYTKGCDSDGANCQLETDASKILVTFGTAVDDPEGEQIRGARIIVHPGYLHRTPYPNDIALLQLADEAKTATPFPYLPDQDGLRWSDADVGTEITVVGYGRTNAASPSSGTRMRMETRVDIYCDPSTTQLPKICYCAAESGFCHASSNLCADDNRFCLASIENFSDSVPLPSVICHTPNASSQLICSGDSGGPSFVTRGETTYVAGVTSFGDLDCRYLGCSTDVSAYAAWIEKTLSADLGIARPLGNICTEAKQCASGHCVDGVCCDDACGNSDCQACARARGATLNGTCTAIEGTCDDGDPCTLNDTCAAGVCVGGEAITCAMPPNDECYESPGTCRTLTGMCHYAALDDGTPCDGGTGTCRSGRCQPLEAVDAGDASTGPALGEDAASGGTSATSPEEAALIHVTGSGLDFLGCAAAPASPRGPLAPPLLLLALLFGLRMPPRARGSAPSPTQDKKNRPLPGAGRETGGGSPPIGRPTLL